MAEHYVVVVEATGKGADVLAKHLSSGCTITRIDRLATSVVYVLCKQ